MRGFGVGVRERGRRWAENLDLVVNGTALGVLETAIDQVRFSARNIGLENIPIWLSHAWISNNRLPAFRSANL